MSNNNQSLEILSNIKGAQEYVEIRDLFKILDNFSVNTQDTNIQTNHNIPSSSLLREDKVQNTSKFNKQIILENSS
jgi:Asp-tRNA(Asn)/Glu-tRNA(Gln) amidotransferase C subunit